MKPAWGVWNKLGWWREVTAVESWARNVCNSGLSLGVDCEIVELIPAPEVESRIAAAVAAAKAEERGRQQVLVIALEAAIEAMTNQRYMKPRIGMEVPHEMCRKAIEFLKGGVR